MNAMDVVYTVIPNICDKFPIRYDHKSSNECIMTETVLKWVKFNNTDV